MHSLYINFDEDFKQISATISQQQSFTSIYLEFVVHLIYIHFNYLIFLTISLLFVCFFFFLLIFPISTQLTDFLSFAAVDLPRRVEKSVYFATQYIYNILIPNNIR